MGRSLENAGSPHGSGSVAVGEANTFTPSIQAICTLTPLASTPVHDRVIGAPEGVVDVAGGVIEMLVIG